MNIELFAAAQIGDMEMYGDALYEGADINESTGAGKTSLMMACEKGFTDLVKFIIERGADRDLQDYQGLTARDYALGGSNPELASLFDDYSSKEQANEAIVRDEDTLYPNLIHNLDTIFKGIQPLVRSIAAEHRPYLLEDFTKALLLAIRGSDFKELYQFSFGLLSYFTMGADNDFDIEQLKKLPQSSVVSTFVNMYAAQEPFFEKLKSYNYNFTLNSLVLFEDSDKDIIKGALYQFCEMIIKADGTVTEQETENLKYISANYFSDTTGNSGKYAFDTNKSTMPNLVKVVEKEAVAQKEVSLETALKELNDLIGLDNIKQDIKSLINIINSNKLRAKEGLPQHKFSLHSVFMGVTGYRKNYYCTNTCRYI